MADKRLRAAQGKGDRAIVDQHDLHVGAELAELAVEVTGLGFLLKITKQCAAMFRCRSGGKAGTVAFLSVGGQRELRHDEQATIDVAQAQVHAVVGVGENAVIENALEQTVGLRSAVVFFYGDQGHDAGADSADVDIVDGDFGFADPLDDGDHARRLENRR